MKSITRKSTALALASLLLVLAASTAAADEDAVAAYRRAIDRICYTGVTPELERLHAAAVKALDAAGYGGGRGSNFGGMRTPEQAYLDCVQAPGDKT